MKNENFITGIIASELIMQQMKADFDFDDYKHIHYTMFSDIYDWAGCIRTISLSKSATVFTRPEDIEELGDRIFKRLRSEKYFAGLPRRDFVNEIADLYNTINILHPFREGNGRTQRVFFMQLIRNAGYDIDFSSLNSELLMIGSIQAAAGVTDNLLGFFDENIIIK
ncbi:MAG: Fic/DOC family protein [Oscillospiraceae bacterium]